MLPPKFCKVTNQPGKRARLVISIVVFPEKYGGTVWRDGAKGKRPETNVLRELLPHLERNTPYPPIEAIGPSWASPWVPPDRSIGEPGTSIFSPSPSLWMREEGPVSRIPLREITYPSLGKGPSKSGNPSTFDWSRRLEYPGFPGVFG